MTGYGDNKLVVIKTIREVTGLGLEEAKDIADYCPQSVVQNVPMERAAWIKAELEKVGATIEIV